MEKILLIKTRKRRESVGGLQQVLTDFGCIIRTRIGLHEAGDVCSDEGLIILQLVDDPSEIKKLEGALAALEDITVGAIEI